MRKIFGLIGALALGAALFAAPQYSRAADLSLDGNLIGQCGQAQAAAGAATLANKCGYVYSETLTAPSSSLYTLTLTNSVATSTDIILWSVGNGSNTTGQLAQGGATVSAGSIVFHVRQASATNLNGTVIVRYMLVRSTGN